MGINSFKKYGLLSFFLALVFIVCGGGSNPARAAVVSDFSNISDTVYRNTVSGTNWIQKGYNSKSNLAKVDLYFAGRNPEMTVVFYICAGDPSGDVSVDYNCNSGQSILYESGSQTIASGTDAYTLDLGTPVDTSGNWYLSVAHPTFSIYMGVIVSNYSSCGRSGNGAEITNYAYPGNPGCAPFYFQTYLRRQTYYENTWRTGAATIDIGAPNPSTITTNSVDFYGTTTNATDFSIWYGPPNASPAEMLTGLNILAYRYAWSFIAQIPNGEWWITYIARNGTTTTMATTSIVVHSLEVNDADFVASSSMSTSTAFDVLTGVTTECGSSSPAYINDPAAFWASNTPTMLQNNSTTSSSSPALYNIIADPVYNATRPAVNMANSFSCYLSKGQASNKGTAAAVTITYYLGAISAINDLFGYPVIYIILVWASGLVLWFVLKLLPFFK